MRNSELRPPGLTPLPDINKSAEEKTKVTHLAVGITMAEAVGINPI